MARVKRGVTTHARHKKVVKQTKGYRGRGSNVYRVAIERLEKGLQYAYRDRRARKRSFRSLWIQRIEAGGGYNKAVIALANKLIRMAWVIVRRNEIYKPATA